jgi:hypothetical protein
MYRISVSDYTYIGSTRDFKQRKQKHKSDCNNVNSHNHNTKVYQMIRENGGWDKSEMVPIEECECEDKLQALIHEEELRKEYNAEMNTIKAYRSIEEKKEYYEAYKKEYDKEWYEENKETILQKYQANKETILQKRKEKYTCDCGSIVCIGNKSTHLKTKKHQDYMDSL